MSRLLKELAYQLDRRPKLPHPGSATRGPAIRDSAANAVASTCSWCWFTQPQLDGHIRQFFRELSLG